MKGSGGVQCHVLALAKGHVPIAMGKCMEKEYSRTLKKNRSVKISILPACWCCLELRMLAVFLLNNALRLCRAVMPRRARTYVGS